MGTHIVIVILLILVAALGGVVAYTLSSLARLKKAVRRVDLEAHLLSEKLDYLRREMEKLDPERYAPKNDWAASASPLPPAGTSAWAPLGSSTATTLVVDPTIDPSLYPDKPPFLEERPKSLNEPPVRLPSLRVADEPPRRSEILPDLKPLVDLLPENMREPDEEPSVLPGSDEPELLHAADGRPAPMMSDGAESRTLRIPTWLESFVTELRTALEPIWRWMRVTNAVGVDEGDGAIARVWLVRAAALLLAGALIGLMLYLVPSMEPEYVTVLGCVAGIACLSLAVVMIDKGAGGLGRLLAVGGLIVTTRAMSHGAWVSGVVPETWAIAILSIGAIAATIAGERNNSLILAGAGMATAFVVPELMALHGVSLRFAAGLCVFLAALLHAVVSLRAWPLLRILAGVYAYVFLAYAALVHTPALRGAALGGTLVLLFASQHALIRLGPRSLPRPVAVGSFWLGVTALFLFVCLELGLMFRYFEQLQALVLMFIVMLGCVLLLERYTQSEGRDKATAVAVGICLVAMVVKLVIDFVPSHPLVKNLIFNAPYGFYEAAIRSLDLGMVAVTFWMAARRVAVSAPKAASVLGGLAFTGTFVYVTFEMNTYLHLYQPAFQGAGLSLLWGFVGVLLTLIGVSGQRVFLKQLGGLFLAVVVIKLLVLDMGRMDMLHRVVALSGVGLLLLAGALPYFRRKKPSSEESIQKEPDSEHAP